MTTKIHPYIKELLGNTIKIRKGSSSDNYLGKPLPDMAGGGFLG
jgi:hypothetical protein